MRNATKRKGKLVLSALAAAGMSAWAGAPVAHGDFSITVYNMGQQTYNGNTWDVFVLAATNDGLNNTGSTLAAADVIIDTGGPSTFTTQIGALGIDIESAGGTGSNAKYSANVNGSVEMLYGQNSVNNQNQAAVPEFGDIVGGTFGGIGTGTFTTDLVNNAQVTQDGANSTGAGNLGGTAAIYVNGQTSDYLASGNVASNFIADFLNPPKTPLLDQGFENGTRPSATVISGNHAGQLLNGMVHSLEIDVVSKDNGGNVVYVPDDTTDNGAVAAGLGGNVPFANIVVPASLANFTVHGQLAAESGGSKSFFQVVTTGTAVIVSSLSISLTASPTNGANIGTVTIVGTNGGYTPGAISVPAGGLQTTGNLLIKNGPGSDFTTATNHNQLIGLDESGAMSISQLESDLQNALQATNPGATVANASNPLLTANGDNVQILFPGGASVPGVNPESLSLDLSQYTANGAVTISQITVVPEPTAIGALALGGLGMLSRRRRKARA